MREVRSHKTGVINDPLGQTHSHASSKHCFLLFCFARFEKWGQTDGRTTCVKTMIPTGSDCGSAEWINKGYWIWLLLLKVKFTFILNFINTSNNNNKELLRYISWHNSYKHFVNRYNCNITKCYRRKLNVSREKKNNLFSSFFSRFFTPITSKHFSFLLIHPANPQPRPVGIIVFKHVARTSVPTFQI